MRVHLPTHLAEYAIEGLLLGAFLVSASTVTIALEHPASPVHQVVPDPVARRVLTGIAMGLTAVALIYSKAGRRSGAHMNPVVTLTFFRLGKVEARDAWGYVAGQVTGAIASMALVRVMAPALAGHPSVNYVRTVPGPEGPAVALVAEAVISFGMMLLVLSLSNSRWRGWTGAAAGGLVALYISVEAPLSGMSMNPARTLGPAAVAGAYDAFWIYVVAPAAGMFGAAELYVRTRGLHRVACAKLHHDAVTHCIFRCRYAPDAASEAPLPGATAIASPTHGH